MRGVALSLLFFGLVGVGAETGDPPVPTDQQVNFLARVLTYDRNLKARAGDAVVIGILHQASNPKSRDMMRELAEAIDRSGVRRVRGLKLSYVPLEIDGGLPSGRELESSGITVIYVTPLQGVDVGAIADLCRANGITSATAVYEYVEAGLAVGLVHNGSRPPVLINLPAAAEEGADFSSHLLKLARVLD